MTQVGDKRIPLFCPEEDRSCASTTKAENVEFAEELADEDDLEARQRAAEADRRACSCEGESE